MTKLGDRIVRALACSLVLPGVLGLAACDPSAVGGPQDEAPTGPSASSDGHGTSPLDNPDGTKPGLAPLTSEADRKAALDLIGKVATKGRGPKTGYDRDEFGYAWLDTADVPLSRNGCDTRNDVLKRDGRDVTFRSGSDCVVVGMALDDPYTGTTIDFRKEEAMAVQIDHVMPLSYDWQMGAARWNEGKRRQIANDPLNLLPVEGRANSAKSDSGPASWLPPNKRIRCSYAVRFAQVALKYDLPVTAPDKRTMQQQCGS
ncbi:HNH endonuclease family protein [Streptomyces meridianus]|uniref:HNH endonuclease family protein n=1 Tax=Streptomyces meridianus TaxID=2938945 RepID=A0ABT0X9E4_9ACTN|nr:HNH endonuclease family protein [Streptomyces meridianus]MCM2579151.1 HNH endonuclease family protein [Streptomyces meridianus]